MLGLPPSILQLVGVADPSTKEPVRVAFTTVAVIAQSVAQYEASSVDHDDGISKIYMTAVLAI